MPSRFNLFPFTVGQILVLKKKHPCGSERWRVERVGADIGCTCLGCNHFHVWPRRQLEKALKDVVEPISPLKPG
jgi:hypothetical protein